jgi:hypothetical protein
MTPQAPKRTLTPRNVGKTVSAVLSSAPVLLAAMVKPKIAPALREKVVLGVTSITTTNRCGPQTPPRRRRSCSRGSTRKVSTRSTRERSRGFASISTTPRWPSSSLTCAPSRSAA